MSEGNITPSKNEEQNLLPNSEEKHQTFSEQKPPTKGTEAKTSSNFSIDVSTLE